jgi:hypothetical protein
MIFAGILCANLIAVRSMLSETKRERICASSLVNNRIHPATWPVNASVRLFCRV